ncbi:MAG: hypothetical protein ACRDTP_12150 [Mycobacteriales bacterium]
MPASEAVEMVVVDTVVELGVETGRLGTVTGGGGGGTVVAIVVVVVVVVVVASGEELIVVAVAGAVDDDPELIVEDEVVEVVVVELVAVVEGAVVAGVVAAGAVVAGAVVEGVVVAGADVVVGSAGAWPVTVPVAIAGASCACSAPAGFAELELEPVGFAVPAAGSAAATCGPTVVPAAGRLTGAGPGGLDVTGACCSAPARPPTVPELADFGGAGRFAPATEPTV